MKYLKTFEDLVTLDLNNTQKEKLMNLAIENDEVSIVKGLLDSGYMPDFLDDLQTIIATQSYTTSINLEIVKLFIDHGYNVNLRNKEGDTVLTNSIYNFRKKSDDKYFAMFKMLIKAGADTSVFVDKGEDWKYDFYYLLDESDRLTKTLKKKILDFLKNEAPKQYDYYLMKKNVNKYNL